MLEQVRQRVDLSDAPWKMHEFFAGSGLVAYGLKNMFAPVWANDNSVKKADVYCSNFISDHFVLDDIRNISGSELPFAHLSWASFPCQDLSLAGSLGGIHAARSGLVWEWLRILQEMPKRPSILLIENVMGLLSTDQGENYKKLHHFLFDLGYKCGTIVVNASYFVPQSRPRVFVIAVCKEVAVPEKLIDVGPNWLHNQASKKIGEDLPGWIWWKAPKLPKRKVELSDILDIDLVFDKDYVLDLIPERHKKVLDAADNIISTGYRRTRNKKQQLELRFDGLAGCLRTPGGGSSKQFVVIKTNGETHARLLTVREAARLMGAPESYILPSSYNDGYKAMGDAVALPVARFIGETFLKPLAEAAYIL